MVCEWWNLCAQRREDCWCLGNGGEAFTLEETVWIDSQKDEYELCGKKEKKYISAADNGLCEQAMRS